MKAREARPTPILERPMRFIMMMHAPKGTGDYQLNDWSPEDFKAHIGFMHQYNKELTAAGQFVDAQGLTPPGQAKLVRAGEGGEPVTDGGFAESKEVLVGWWGIEVDSPEEGYPLAAKGSGPP